MILAAAPLRAAGTDAIGRLLVPPAALRSVELDITNEPGQPRSGHPLRGVVAAVALGRAAARAERLGDGPEAGQRWEHAADAWSRAGDHARAGLALELPARSRPRARADQVPAPLLADAVVDSDR